MTTGRLALFFILPLNFSYSYRSASIGSRFAAFHAG